MKPRRTPTTDLVLSLPGGNEDSDLWCRRGATDGLRWIESVWDLDDEERQAIAAGGTIELRVYGLNTPPVSLAVGDSLETRRAESLEP